tara:strand:+ start:2907 stop:3827 length:921 start_codon:yes stop_codon:yes gene_type:complete
MWGQVAQAGMQAIGGIIQGISASRAAKKARARTKKLEGQLRNLEANRQDIIDPSDRMVDRSGMIQNQFSNLQVATGAAEMQAEEADISLAGTLDTLRATGAGAGGATALAQAALRSKKGIAATIETQEAQNARLRAQGAQQAQQARLAEGGRVDLSRQRGAMFEFQSLETRQQGKIENVFGQIEQSRAQANALQGQAAAGFGQAMGGAAGALGGGIAGSAALKQKYSLEKESDRRLKKNIKLIGYSPSGLKIYIFEYINKALGKGLFQGVMSDEIPQHAVVKDDNGYDQVDYSKLDVTFKRIQHEL